MDTAVDEPTGRARQSIRPTRRQLLVASVAGGTAAGAAVTGLRVLLQRPQTAGAVPGPKLPPPPKWATPLIRERARVAQLLRRTTFGFTAAELDAAAIDGFNGTVDRLIGSLTAEPPQLIPAGDPTRGARLNTDDLQRWWITHLLTTPTRFGERMTYFWHGHFTSNFDKSGTPFIYWQNLTWRRMALGKLGDMLHQVTLDPAMLNYLDLAESDASDPTQPPNENYARELMELFAMGARNYSEADVKGAAKALAGWLPPPADRQVEVVVDPMTGAKETFDVWDHQHTGNFDSAKAFDGDVSFLSKSGRLNLDDVIERILAQPATATHIARRVAVHFIAAKPSPETLTRLADTFRASGYEVKSLLRAVFTSKEFSAPEGYRGLIKSPLEFMTGAAIAVGLRPEDAVQLIVDSAEGMGEALFSPPNVAGWPPNERWISPGTILARVNFVSDLLDLKQTLPPFANAVEAHLDGVLNESTRTRLAHANDDTGRWLVLLASPEFNLK